MDDITDALLTEMEGHAKLLPDQPGSGRATVLALLAVVRRSRVRASRLLEDIHQRRGTIAPPTDDPLGELEIALHDYLEEQRDLHAEVSELETKLETAQDDAGGFADRLEKVEKERDETQGRLEECERAAEELAGERDEMRATIVTWLRARARTWRTADPAVPRDNLLVADTLDGAANSIERNQLEG